MQEYMTEIFNSRELATFFWIIGLSIWLINKSGIRGSLWKLTKSLFAARKFFVLLFIYIAISLYILYEVSFWDFSLLKITIYWVVGWSIIAFVNTPRIHRNKDYLKKAFGEVAGFTVAITFLVNFYTFPLLVELFLVPFAFIVITMTMVAKMKDGHEQVHEFLGYVQITFGTAILFFCLYQALADISIFANFTTLREFLLPIILSIMLLPFLYAMSIYGEYEQRRLREKFLNKKNVSPQI